MTGRILFIARLLAIVSALGLGGVRSGVAATPGGPAPGPECAGTLPLVLNAGLSPSGRYELAKVENLARALFTDLYEDPQKSPCSAERALQVNLAVGSDYQILHWLRNGSVDVAVVPAATLHLLSQEGVDLLEIQLPETQAAAILPRWRPRLTGRPLATGEEVGVDPEAVFQKLRERIWASLTGDAGRLAALVAGGSGGCEELWRGREPRARLTFPSHLSSTGFVAPVAATRAWLAGDGARLGKLASLDEELRPTAESCFWQAFFRFACFSAEGDRIDLGDGAAPGAGACDDRWRREAAGAGVEIHFGRELEGPGQAAQPAVSGEDSVLRQAVRDHLVIRRPAADAIFSQGAFKPARAELPPGFRELLDRAAGPPDPSLPIDPVAEFRSMAVTQPYFGVRTFAFTADEAVRLIREHQRLGGRRNLALILPGGGVKAAYQSRLVDSLYGEGRLRNAWALTEPGPNVTPPVEVHHVIGTSGGALIGYFVARLGQRGPWELAEVLWEKEPGVVLTATDVFGSTDLPRYLSMVVIFALLCAVLLLFSIGVSSPLAPRERPPTAGAWRVRLSFVVFSVLLLTPLLVRSVTGELHEHVPEIEGLLFLVLIVLAVFADQCVVLAPEAEHRRRERVPGWIYALLALGLLSVAVPAFWPTGTEEPAWPARELPFGLAYLVLGIVALVAGMIVPVRGPVGLRAASGRRRLLAVAGDAFLVLAALPLFALWLAPTLRLIESLPIFLTGFLLLFLIGGVWMVAVAEKGPTLAGRRRWVAYYAALAAATIFLLGLCRPESLSLGLGLTDAFFEPSRLDAPTGAFLVCIGAVVAFGAGIAWVLAASPHYELRERRVVTSGVLVVLGHVMVVYAALLALGWWWSNGPSMLELTGGFWAWLGALGLGTALVLVGLGVAGPRDRPWLPWLRGCLRHLCSHHPNGAVLSRRFLRMLGLAGFGLVWWNLVLAPAFYGNRYAVEVLNLSLDSFDRRYVEVHGGGDPYLLTANFVAPANVLERDGTRYFVVVPTAANCPSLPRTGGPGAVWYLYHLDTGPLDHAGHGSCRSLDLRTLEDREFLKYVIFASGSPFPIFPGKVTTLPPPDDGRKRLVDGGYSNDTPVEAALILGADQVLIIQSSHPLGHAKGSSLLRRLLAFAGTVPGPLVEDLGRLPGYLFERSQQVDRQSRRDLFVVTLAPRRSERNWPSLSDFRGATVERMRRTAAADLEQGRRIGFVESWGPPRFQLSVTVPPTERATH